MRHEYERSCQDPRASPPCNSSANNQRNRIGCNGTYQAPELEDDYSGDERPFDGEEHEDASICQLKY